MPRGDQTGPMGMGPRSGRGPGNCAGFAVPGYSNPAAGRGMGMGGGFGPGWGNPVVAAPMPEKELLSLQAKALEQLLNAVKKSLTDLDTARND